MLKTQILLYNGRGVSLLCFQNLFKALRSYFPASFSIRAVDHTFFLEGGWEEQTALIAFPGGRDLPYHTALKGAANQAIKTYVEKGGHFLGICAGGYYGAAYIEFEKGGPLEVCGERELAFYPGKAVGPAFGKGIFQYENESGAYAAQIIWKEGESSVYFNGGCFFEGVEKYPTIEILAHYAELSSSPAAAVYCPFGRGGALLTGIHPEFCSEGAPLFNFLLDHLYNLNFNVL